MLASTMSRFPGLTIQVLEFRVSVQDVERRVKVFRV